MLDEQRRLVAALGLPVTETHISYVLFDRGTVYKIKKAVRFPFLDFSTLTARAFYCCEELRLNRRLAPSIYLDVVRVTGTPEAPVLEGDGEAVEWAVKMREFDQDGLLSRVIARDELTTARVDALAAAVAAFHGRTTRAGAGLPYGHAAGVLADARENAAAFDAGPIAPADRALIDALRDWTEREGARCTPAFESRRQHGFVRECHGDLHLGNIALVDGAVTLFDCIEFNPAMRWIDVMSDVAFLVMDLRDRGRPDLAARFLNAYLERTGDYAGLDVLRFYVVYRAMVRAKIAWLRIAQTAETDGSPQRAALLDECRAYLELARRETSPAPPRIVITHGVAGSGKSTRALALVDAGAIAVRSDVERKRLFGLSPDARTASALGSGLYTADADRQTYAALADLCRIIAKAGYTAVVDATFLKRWQRDGIRKVADDLGVPFVIADCAAPVAVLQERVAHRLARGADASEATLDVLTRQLATEEPLGQDEQPYLM